MKLKIKIHHPNSLYFGHASDTIFDVD